jgi:hypothetical protein
MHLADHRVARDAVAQLIRDLAGAQTVEPHLFQLLDAFIGPGHRLASKPYNVLVLPARPADRQSQPARPNARTPNGSNLTRTDKADAHSTRAARDVVAD